MGSKKPAGRNLPIVNNIPQLPDEPAQPAGIDLSLARFLVRGNLTSISHGDCVFPVEDGVVNLPVLPAPHFYSDLVAARILIPES